MLLNAPQAHQLPNKIEKAYLRSDLLKERIKIMNDWEKYILSQGGVRLDQYKRKC